MAKRIYRVVEQAVPERMADGGFVSEEGRMCSEVSGNCNERATEEDVREFRIATLRAMLSTMGMSFERNADEATLIRLMNIAEQRQKRRLLQRTATDLKQNSVENSLGRSLESLNSHSNVL